MIDIDTTNLILQKANLLELTDYDFAVAVQQENKALRNTIIIGLTIGAGILIYKLYQDGKQDKD